EGRPLGSQGNQAYLKWRGKRIKDGVKLDLATVGFDERIVYVAPFIKEYEPGSPEQLAGLVLEKVNGERGQYRRCACMWLLKDWVEGLLTAAKTTELAEDEFLDRHKDGKVTITLI